MADQPGSVVPEMSGVTETQFRGAMLAGLGRCEKAHGRPALGYVMGLESKKQVDNIFERGSMPGAKRLWDALSACPSALDDIAALYGVELVRKAETGAAAAFGTVPLAALLARVAEAESPTSHGGTAKTHQELLAMEDDIRVVHALTAEWINEINRLRAPRAVTG